MDFVITTEMQAEIGVESAAWPYEVTTTGIRAFARGVGYEDPVYYDVEAAATAGYEQLPAPPCFLGAPVYRPGYSDPVFSVPRGSGPRPRYGLTRVLDGGTETIYERPLQAGETLSVTDRLLDLTVKQSRSLGTMLIVSREATYRDQAGETVARERSHYVFYES
jgi:N-terminal half of MaoC dehydratase